jgi:hypothetical protein
MHRLTLAARCALIITSLTTLSAINASDSELIPSPNPACDPAAAYTRTLFAPYDGPFPVSLEARFEGFFGHLLQRLSDPLLSSLFTFNGYIKLPHLFFMKVGTVLGERHRCLQRAAVDLQFGRYWPEWGAVRAGLFADGLGVGGDFWVIYRNRFKWMTTLEVSTFCDQRRFSFGFDTVRPSVKWLNRFFVYGTFFISAGVEHIHGRHGLCSVTQGFIGFGTTI